MTIASEITKLNTNLTNSYTACNNKGATMPTNQNFDNLATCIGSIQTGTTPTLITKNITQNGTYNASSDNADGYSSVTVNVSGGGGTTKLYAFYNSNLTPRILYITTLTEIYTSINACYIYSITAGLKVYADCYYDGSNTLYDPQDNTYIRNKSRDIEL